MPADFRAVQKSLTDWLRDPVSAPVPAGMERRRLDVYRELFFNNVSGFVENAYPVLQSLTAPAEWQRLVAGFFAQHRCHTPYFREIAREFLDHLERGGASWVEGKPWRRELAHFEWAEMAAEFTGDDALPAGVCAQGDLLDNRPVPAPALWVLVYRWPVHLFTAENPPGTEPPPQPCCLLVFRDADDGVRRLEVNALTARLVECLQQEAGLTGRALLARVAAEAGMAVDADFVAAGAATLEELRQAGVIRGVLQP